MTDRQIEIEEYLKEREAILGVMTLFAEALLIAVVCCTVAVWISM